MYCPNGNLVKFSHTNRISSELQKHIGKPRNNQSALNLQKLPLAQGQSRPSSNTLFLTWLNSPLQIQLDHFTRFHTAMPQIPHCLQWVIYPKNCPFLWGDQHSIYSTHFWTHTTHYLNSIQIQSSVFSHSPDRHTDYQPDRKSIHRKRSVAIG